MSPHALLQPHLFLLLQTGAAGFGGTGGSGKTFSCIHTSHAGQQSLYSQPDLPEITWCRQTLLHTPNLAWPHSWRFCKLLPLCLEMNSNGLLNNCAIEDSNSKFQAVKTQVLGLSLPSQKIAQRWLSEKKTKKQNSSICDLYLPRHINQLWFIKFLKCFYRATLVFRLQNISTQHGGKSLFTQKTKRNRKKLSPFFNGSTCSSFLIWILKKWKSQFGVNLNLTIVIQVYGNESKCKE